MEDRNRQSIVDTVDRSRITAKGERSKEDPHPEVPQRCEGRCQIDRGKTRLILM